MATVENYAKAVIKMFFFLFTLKIEFNFQLNEDNSCWNSPCEGCKPTAPNSSDYFCFCSKFAPGTDNCNSEIKRNQIEYFVNNYEC